MDEFIKWLENGIKICSEDKDLYREHWVFCQALKKYREVALRQQPVMGMMAVSFAKWLRNNTIADGAPKLLLRSNMKRYTIEELYDLYTML